MCIRDRYTVSLLLTDVIDAILLFYLTPVWSTLAGLALFGAVSYTHLRAHETPEHLVCRLLLEKKKHNVLPVQILRLHHCLTN